MCTHIHTYMSLQLRPFSCLLDICIWIYTKFHMNRAQLLILSSTTCFPMASPPQSMSAHLSSWLGQKPLSIPDFSLSLYPNIPNKEIFSLYLYLYPSHKQILLALPSKCTQNLTSSHYLHCYDLSHHHLLGFKDEAKFLICKKTWT